MTNSIRSEGSVGENLGSRSFEMKSFKKVFAATPLHPGSGPLLAFKQTLLALQPQAPAKKNGKQEIMPSFVVSGPAADVAKHVADLKYFITDSPASAARGLSVFEKTVVFADQHSAIKALPSIVDASKNNENFLFICYNTEEYSLAPMIRAAYVATACTAYPEDYIAKVKKAMLEAGGLKFIEILCPDPKSGFDASNAIEVGRLAVESSLWPLYEFTDQQLTLTKRPIRLEPLDRYTSIQKKFENYSMEQIAAWQEKVNKRWKLLLDGRLV
ncbi:MAG: hypothetical protein HY513_03985 [Candidatus Aenigmarchaeota archaeon]|nr:hypothetical protein [Candidatus Aenigmarchaeota archaeon]